MSNFAFSIANFSISGSGTLNLKIPGTFAGPVPADPTGTGRYFKEVFIWSGNAVDGDKITTLQLVDNDGVAVAYSAAFPNYPVMYDFLDQISGQNKELDIPPDGVLLQAYDTSGNLNTKFLPSGLYFVVTFASGGGLLRTFRGNIRWGQWQ